MKKILLSMVVLVFNTFGFQIKDTLYTVKYMCDTAYAINDVIRLPNQDFAMVGSSHCSSVKPGATAFFRIVSPDGQITNSADFPQPGSTSYYTILQAEKNAFLGIIWCSKYFLIAQLDSVGNVTRTRAFPATFFLNKLFKAKDGNYFVRLYSRDAQYNNNPGLLKISFNLDSLWYKEYPDSGSSTGLNIADDGHDGYYLWGSEQITYRATSTWTEKTRLIRIDSNGNVIWDKTYKLPNTSKTQPLDFHSDGSNSSTMLIHVFENYVGDYIWKLSLDSNGTIMAQSKHQYSKNYGFTNLSVLDDSTFFSYRTYNIQSFTPTTWVFYSIRKSNLAVLDSTSFTFFYETYPKFFFFPSPAEMICFSNFRNWNLSRENFFYNGEYVRFALKAPPVRSLPAGRSAKSNKAGTRAKTVLRNKLLVQQQVGNQTTQYDLKGKTGKNSSNVKFGQSR